MIVQFISNMYFYHSSTIYTWINEQHDSLYVICLYICMYVIRTCAFTYTFVCMYVCIYIIMQVYSLPNINIFVPLISYLTYVICLSGCSDLKTQNILLDASWTAKLCDYSFIILENNPEITRYSCGTTEFMSPEMILSENEITCATVRVYVYVFIYCNSLVIMIFTYINVYLPLRVCGCSCVEYNSS